QSRSTAPLHVFVFFVFLGGWTPSAHRSRAVSPPIRVGPPRAPPPQKAPTKNCGMHIMTALPPQPPPPQEQLLLHELNHRIGNEFCCAISVVSLAAARSSDKEVKAVLTE